MGMDEAKLAFLRAFPTAPTDGSRHLAFMKGFRAATRWRKWPEEKPEGEGTFFVTDSRGEVAVDHCLQAVPGGDLFWMFHPDTKAWQPLPAPYQPEGAAKAERKEEP